MLSRDILDGAVCIQLLPRAAYSAHDPAQWHTLGVTLERQKGVHAINSDRRVDFDTFPGVLAQAPIGVDVFSESMSGGEYLVLRMDRHFANCHLPMLDHRIQSAGNIRALRVAQKIRRALISPQVDHLSLEQTAMSLVELARPAHDRPQRLKWNALKPVLDQISELYRQPLTLEQLAATYGCNALRLLRDFTRAVGTTPHAYLIEIRLQAARHLIEKTDLPLAIIALEVGFAHQSHMGSAFRQHLDITLGDYRRRSGSPA